MIRSAALLVRAVVTIGVVLSLAHASALAPLRNDKSSVAKPLRLSKSGCLAELDGKTVQFQLGEGIQIGKEWLSCQEYDGHPVVIHSSDSLG